MTWLRYYLIRNISNRTGLMGVRAQNKGDAALPVADENVGKIRYLKIEFNPFAGLLHSRQYSLQLVGCKGETGLPRVIKKFVVDSHGMADYIYEGIAGHGNNCLGFTPARCFRRKLPQIPKIRVGFFRQTAMHGAGNKIKFSGVFRCYVNIAAPVKGFGFSAEADLNLRVTGSQLITHLDVFVNPVACPPDMIRKSDGGQAFVDCCLYACFHAVFAIAVYGVNMTICFVPVPLTVFEAIQAGDFCQQKAVLFRKHVILPGEYPVPADPGPGGSAVQ